MDLPNTLLLLSRDPQLIAARPRGVVIRVTEGHVLQRIGVPHPYRYQPYFGDLVAMDWFVGTIDQVRKQLGAEAGESN